MKLFQATHIIDQCAAEDRRWLEFLRTADMSAGLYHLPVGAVDGQAPHTEDEIYVVLAGEGKITINDCTEPVKAHSIIFVPAMADHHFHDITAPLKLLVIFAPAEHTRADMHGHLTWYRPSYRISTNPTHLDVDAIHRYLAHDSYWAAGITREAVQRAINHSLCFGVYHKNQQIGLARLITDYATFAYLSDVYLLEEHRNRGLGIWLVQTILSHPDLQGLRKWSLHTNDAHDLYTRFGFRAMEELQNYMEYRP